MRFARWGGEFLSRLWLDLWRCHCRSRQDAAFIAFTGSKASASTSTSALPSSSRDKCGSSARFSKMGGKDAIVVDADTDVDTAVEGVAQAAFGSREQKCSACSRAIVDENIYDEFVAKLEDSRREADIGRSRRESQHVGRDQRERHEQDSRPTSKPVRNKAAMVTVAPALRT